MAEVTAQDVRALIRKLRADGLSDSTVRNRLDPLRAIYRHEIEEDRLDFNPTTGLRLPSGGRTRTPSASFEDVAALVEAIRPADRALWAAAFYAGLRRGELRALRVSDVDFEANLIRVRRGWDEKAGPIDPKSEAGERDVPLADVLRDYLLDHLAHVHRGQRDGADLIFGRTAEAAFVPSSVGNRAKTDFKRAGLAPVTLHDGRHLFASFLIYSSPDIDALTLCEVMGHSSVQMTFDLYGHLLPGRRSEIRDALNRHLIPAPR